MADSALSEAAAPVGPGGDGGHGPTAGSLDGTADIPKPCLNSAIALSRVLSSASRARRLDLLEHLGVPSADERPELGLETLHVLYRHVVDVPSHACVDDDDLLFDRQRDVQTLFQQLRQAIAAIELGL